MSRIVHLFPDSVFLRFTVDVFEEAAPGLSTFFVYSQRRGPRTHSVPGTEAVRQVSTDAAGLAEVMDALRGSDLAIFHSVGEFAARALRDCPHGPARVWSGWGGDYYGADLNPHAGLLGPLTTKFARQPLTIRARLGRYRLLYRSTRPLHAAARAADLFSAPIPNDVQVFRRRFREFRGSYVQLNYASVEDTFAPGAPVPAGDDILVGNSAALTNNHLELLELLSSQQLRGRRVVVPLSYGNPGYADAVMARGRELFGSDFVALRDFLPLRDYVEIISRCGVVMMGHRRQQGIGNVATALWSGAAVALDRRSPLTHFLRERGARVHTLDEVQRQGLPAAPDVETREQNRRVLMAFWSRSAVVSNAERLVAASLGR